MTDESNVKSNFDLVELTADVVSAYVSNNPVPVLELPALITQVHQSLATLGSAKAPVADEEKPVPAVPVKKSVTPDFIICLEDGKKFKSLKRHLTTHYNMTPEDYRAKWHLPRDYPMVAPNYAAQRSALALASGLGRKGAPAPAAPRKARAAKAPAKSARAKA